MPAYYDLPNVFNQGVEDIDKFNRLPFYLVKNEVELFPQWNIWDQLFGDINWQQNMGDTMKGVRPEPSPVGRTLFYPVDVVSGLPNKDVFEVLESTEQAKVKWHEYESKQFAFVPSWQDFRDNQIGYAHKDLVRQIQNGNNAFIRTIVWDKSPTVFLAGTGPVDAPTGDGNTAQSAANSKSATWLIAQLPNIKSNLSLRVIQNAATVLEEDLDAPFFEGAKNMPQPNEVLKGKYVLLDSNESWLQFPWDTSTNALKSINLDLIFQGFRGSLFDMVTFRSDKWPLRFGDDGLFSVPQLTQAGTNKTRKNPNYANISAINASVTNPAKWGVAFLIGAAGYRTIKVGPPPRDFTGLSADKFYKMRWNGEVQLTDQFLIQRGTIIGGDLSYETNQKGRFLKLTADCTHGILPAEVYNVMPILYKRSRVAMV